VGDDGGFTARLIGPEKAWAGRGGDVCLRPRRRGVSLLLDPLASGTPATLLHPNDPILYRYHAKDGTRIFQRGAVGTWGGEFHPKGLITQRLGQSDRYAQGVLGPGGGGPSGGSRPASRSGAGTDLIRSGPGMAAVTLLCGSS